jgi:hypothetical protein
MFYQAGHLLTDTVSAIAWLVAMVVLQVVCFTALIMWGRSRIDLIPVVNI